MWAFARDFFLIEQCTTVYCVTVTGYYLYRLLCGACTVSVTVRACALQIFHRRTQALTVAETRCTSLCVRRGAPFSPLPQRTDEAIAARCLINTPNFFSKDSQTPQQLQKKHFRRRREKYTYVGNESENVIEATNSKSFTPIHTQRHTLSI